MKKEKNMNKMNVILFIMCSIIFILPSVIYLIKNRTIYRFVWVWTYLFRMPTTQSEKILNTVLFFCVFSLLFLLYFMILKKHKQIFKNKKQIFTLIIIVSLLFLFIIPYTSTDVYSYIANGWSAAHYQENPYYTSTGQIVDKTNTRDAMFDKVANCWRYETVVYGPLWTSICTLLSGLSFGNIDMALLVFKIMNLIVHIVNCVLIYKITKKNLFVILYGLNPFILFEALSNVHNDIFIILFTLLAIYFVTRKKKIFVAVACIAAATAIKYLAILILPFIVLYAVKDKEIKDRIKYCIICGIEYVAIIALFYLIYLKDDLTVLSGVLIQQSKYNRSILYLIYEILKQDTQKVAIIQNIALALFAVYYVYVAVKILISKKVLTHTIMQKYYGIIMIFTFVLITNFNPWYIMWLFPMIFLVKGKSIKNILYLSYACEIANIVSFALWSEKQILGIPYFLIMIITVGIIKLKNSKLEREKDGKIKVLR